MVEIRTAGIVATITMPDGTVVHCITLPCTVPTGARLDLTDFGKELLEKGLEKAISDVTTPYL